MTNEQIIAQGREVISIERSALARVEKNLGSAFARAVRMLSKCSGNVIVTGVGKSGIIARKISSSLNSTGTSSVFLHPNDAAHGDVGIVRKDDVVVLLSKSGNTPELTDLLPALLSVTSRVVVITGNQSSNLAKSAAIVLDCSVEREACDYDLAPTASTTAMLAVGDALAVTLYKTKGFTRESFASSHPGGMLGRRLNMSVTEIMKTGEAIPRVKASAKFSDVIVEMSRKRLGCTLVVTGKGSSTVAGIITDGDLRRLLQKSEDVHSLTAATMMTKQPMSITEDVLGSDALTLLEQKKQQQLPVINASGRLVGIVHLHDLIDAGL